VHHPVITRTLRRNGELSIIVLTVRDHETDQIIGLELGADDYVTKLFSPHELVARTRSVLRKHAGISYRPRPSGRGT
jgi:DNA-binding response OmpR family regulator